MPSDLKAKPDATEFAGLVQIVGLYSATSSGCATLGSHLTASYDVDPLLVELSRQGRLCGHAVCRDSQRPC
jgi:hypothetical protein